MRRSGLRGNGASLDGWLLDDVLNLVVMSEGEGDLLLEGLKEGG